MGLFLEFDAKNEVLRGTLVGRVTDAILLDSYAEATRCAKLLSPCRGIWDFSKVTEFDVSTNAIKRAVGLTPIIPAGYLRVIVASRDAHFGMMRMLQMLSEQSRPELHVVRTMDEAYRLLRVDSPKFSPVSFPT